MVMLHSLLEGCGGLICIGISSHRGGVYVYILVRYLMSILMRHLHVRLLDESVGRPSLCTLASSCIQCPILSKSLVQVCFTEPKCD